MLCDGCGETRQDVLTMTVGTTLITIEPQGVVPNIEYRTPEVDIRAKPYNLCVECRNSVKLGLMEKIGNYIRGIRRKTGT